MKRTLATPTVSKLTTAYHLADTHILLKTPQTCGQLIAGATPTNTTH
jgi:hypothetical protein